MKFLAPEARENRWSDLLATLIDLDPNPIADLLGLPPHFDVRREQSVARSGDSGGKDQVDLVLVSASSGRVLAVIEAKLFADLGLDQLSRYGEAFPDASVYRLLHLATLPFSLAGFEGWESLTWEQVLDAYAESAIPWAAATAQAWRDQLHQLVPDVGADTVWRDVPVGPRDFELALRARTAWLAARMTQWCTLEHDLVQSTAGGTWIPRMWKAIDLPGTYVSCEVEEGMTAQGWKPDPESPYRNRLVGPRVLIGLQQEGVDSSSQFPWEHLHRMFSAVVLDGDGRPRADDPREWVTTRPNLHDAEDKAAWSRMVSNGAPPWLGKGFGMRQAKKFGTCLFGARYQLAPSLRLSDIDDELQSLERLVVRLADVPLQRA